MGEFCEYEFIIHNSYELCEIYLNKVFKKFHKVPKGHDSFFILKNSCFTMLYQSLLYSKVTQLYTYTHSFLYSFPLWFITGY